jgi:2-polyprenyl-6-methoxyphenol hydroxylase-like FAD-dependent oxidoreductase
VSRIAQAEQRPWVATVGRRRPPPLSDAEGGSETPMDILISGAGLAGLTTAYWLRRYGFIATIVERAPSLVTGGYKIDVRGTALDVLRRTGVHDAVAASSTQMQGAPLVDRDGKVINRMAGDEFGHRVGGDLEIVRGTLCEILRTRTTDVEAIFGDVIASITQSDDGVEVTFRDGDARTFDLVADYSAFTTEPTG